MSGGAGGKLKVPEAYLEVQEASSWYLELLEASSAYPEVL